MNQIHTASAGIVGTYQNEPVPNAWRQPIVVTRINKLARSVSDLCGIVKRLEAAGVALVALEQPIDTSKAAGRCFLQFLGVFAEFETAIRYERQMAGVAAAREKGVYKGRKPSNDAERVRALAASGMGGTAISRELNVSRASVYRLLGPANDA